MPALSPDALDKVRSGIETSAITLFVKKGFHGTSIRDIARQAGVSLGCIYGHYQGKDALFAAIAERYRKVFAQPDNPVLRYLGDTRFPDDIPEMALAIRELIELHRDFWLLWYVDVLEFQGQHFGSTFLHDPGLGHPGVQRRLKELRATSRLRIEPELAFRMVYMHLFNFVIVETLFGGKEHYGVPINTAIDAIVDVFLFGIVQPSSEAANGPQLSVTP